MDKEVAEALGRAALSMQETMQALGEGAGSRMPIEEARRTQEALNRLALALLENGEEVGNSAGGTGLQNTMQELAELARRQGALSSQANSLLPLDLGPRALNQELQQMAREQADIARKLGGMNNGASGSDDVFGQLDLLAREAEELARELSGGRLTPELLARQERLFHRLLDAGRTLEHEETSPERVAERPGEVGVSSAAELDPALLHGGVRYPLPGPEVLRNLPPAYRRLVIEYFDRLNRAAAAESRKTAAGAGKEQGR